MLCLTEVALHGRGVSVDMDVAAQHSAAPLFSPRRDNCAEAPAPRKRAAAPPRQPEEELPLRLRCEDEDPVENVRTGIRLLLLRDREIISDNRF